MRPKLTAKSIQYVIDQMKNDKGAGTVAKEMHVKQQYIQRLWAEYLRTETAHQQIPAGLPKNPAPSDMEIQMVLDAHNRKPEGAIRTASRLKGEGHNISRSQICQIMKSNGLVVDSPAKSRRRKWIRYERHYSNAMWHTDWYAIKDPRMRNLNLITYSVDQKFFTFRDFLQINSITSILGRAVLKYSDIALRICTIVA